MEDAIKKPKKPSPYNSLKKSKDMPLQEFLEEEEEDDYDYKQKRSPPRLGVEPKPWEEDENIPQDRHYPYKQKHKSVTKKKKAPTKDDSHEKQARNRS